MSTILLLEDHTALRNSMAEALGELPDVSVAPVGTLAEAIRALDEHLPDLVISDLDLPDGSGVELMSHLGRPSSIPVVFVSAHVPRYRTMLRECPGVTVRHKPISLGELQSLVRDKLGAPLDDSPFSPADYIQLACMGRHSVRIEVKQGPLKGAIIVREGKLWSAQVGLLQGTAALGRLAFVDGHTRCVSLRHQPKDRNLPDQSWEQLLLEAARQKDEDDHNGIAAVDDLSTFFDDLDDTEEEEPTLPQAPKVDSSDIRRRTHAVQATPRSSSHIEPIRVEKSRGLEVASMERGKVSEPISPDASTPIVSEDEAEYFRLVESGADALLQKDYHRALQLYERAQRLRPGDSLVRANITRLTEIIECSQH